jgi:hypothetical protein
MNYEKQRIMRTSLIPGEAVAAHNSLPPCVSIEVPGVLERHGQNHCHFTIALHLLYRVECSLTRCGMPLWPVRVTEGPNPMSMEWRLFLGEPRSDQLGKLFEARYAAGLAWLTIVGGS